MKTYTTLRNLYGTLTKNTSTANLTLGDELINDSYHSIISLKDFSFLRRARTVVTVASTQYVDLPYDTQLVESVSVQVGSTKYTPKLMHSREEWDLLNQTTYTSDTPRYAFIYNGQIGLWPTPATSGLTITLNGKIRPVPLTIADYTTGSVTDLVNGDATVELTGTTLVDSMVGRWIKVLQDNTSSSGDGRWYEIASITDTDTLELVREYGGGSVAAATQSYIIGQVPLLPEFAQDAPVYEAASIYWDKEGDHNRSTKYMNKRNEKVATLVSQFTSENSDVVLQEGAGIDQEYTTNPNLTITL